MTAPPRLKTKTDTMKAEFDPISGPHFVLRDTKNSREDTNSEGGVVKTITSASTQHSNTSTAGTAGQIRVKPELKSETFWFDDGNLLLKTGTEDVLFFLIHQSVICRTSTVFSKEISKMITDGRGSTKSILLIVNGDGKIWSAILSHVYPLCATDNHEQLCKEEWIKIYDTARLYDFESIRKLAVDKITVDLEKFVDLVKLGRKQSGERQPEWCMQGYKGLCERDNPLTVDEGKALGVEDAVKIAEAREKLISGSTWDEVSGLFEK